jgi:hypothetical protein
MPPTMLIARDRELQRPSPLSARPPCLRCWMTRVRPSYIGHQATYRIPRPAALCPWALRHVKSLCATASRLRQSYPFLRQTKCPLPCWHTYAISLVAKLKRATRTPWLNRCPSTTSARIGSESSVLLCCWAKFRMAVNSTKWPGEAAIGRGSASGASTSSQTTLADRAMSATAAFLLQMRRGIVVLVA